MSQFIRTNPIRWPYSLGQLRADEPSRSFSSAPSDRELAVYNCYRVVDQPHPEYDPAAEKVVEVQPIEQDGQWLQQWEVVAMTPAEVEAYYRATHPPQWIAFNEALPPEVSTLLGNAQAIDHRLYLGLGVGLGKAADGDARIFLGLWAKANAAGLIAPELRAEIQTLATAHDLPAEFVAGLAE
jgi:hypothetical protein